MRTIEICSSCGGTGDKWETDLDYEQELKTCETCRGTGRVYRIKYQIEVPFTTNESRMIEADTKIIDILRKI